MIIVDAKVLDATRISDLENNVFEGWRHDVPSHRTFTWKERHSYVNPSELRKRWWIRLVASTKGVEGDNSEGAQIVHNAYLSTIHVRTHV